MTLFRKFEKMLDSNTKRYFISFFIVSAILVLSYFFFSVRFETNDDSAIMYNIAGYRSGHIEVDPIFSGVLWGMLVGAGYYLVPQIPWYSIFSIFVIGISHIIILQSMLKRRKKSSTLLIYIILFFGVALYSIINLQFTTTAMWPGIAACILGLDIFKNKENNVLKCSLIAFLLLLCCSIRLFVGISAIGFFLTALFINAVSHLRDFASIWKKIFVVFVIACLTLLFTVAVNTIYESINGEWKEWREYHKERSTYKDYSSLSYEEAKETYESIGWSKNLYDLAQGWFFMDPKINKDSFQTLNQCTEDSSKKTSFKERLYSAGIYLKQVWIYIPITRILLISELSIIAYLLGITFIKKDKILFIKVSSVACVSGLMIIYLCLKGRLPLRAFQVCVLPAIFILYTMLLEIRAGTVIEKSMRMIVMLIGGVCMMGNIRLAHINSSILDVGIDLRMKMEEYAIQYPKNIYVYDSTMSFGAGPFVTYPMEKPTNYIFWGGSTMFSPIYERQIRFNGKNTLYSDAFFEENVYFVSRRGIEDSSLIKYLTEEYGYIEYQLIETVDSCQIYKFYKTDESDTNKI